MKASAAKDANGRRVSPAAASYHLEQQIGYVLRQASQRHAAIFNEHIPDALTTTQFAALAKLQEVGPCSQNRLGRMTSMDGATIKGVTDRLIQRGLVEARPDPEDNRHRVLALTAVGLETALRAIPAALSISDETLKPLAPGEREQFLNLLKKLR